MIGYLWKEKMQTSAKNLRSFGTHDGVFHADEVSACALLLLFDLIDRKKIVRTRDPLLLDACEYVCDVGGEYDPKQKLFDHHQVEYQGPLSSAGMVLLFLHTEGIITDAELSYLKQEIIDGIDAHDNGKDPLIPGLTTYSDVIANFTPIKRDSSDKELNQEFERALDFAYQHFKRLFEKLHYIQSCRESVAEAMKVGKEYLLFDQAIPWMESFFDLGGAKHPAKFVVMPAGTHWKLRGIPPSLEDKMNVRHPLPFEWAGLSEEELRKKNQHSGSHFLPQRTLYFYLEKTERCT